MTKKIDDYASYSGTLTVAATDATTKKITLNGVVQQPVGNHVVNVVSHVVSVEFFSTTGQKLRENELKPGVVIEKVQFSNGSVQTNKKIIK